MKTKTTTVLEQVERLAKALLYRAVDINKEKAAKPDWDVDEEYDRQERIRKSEAEQLAGLKDFETLFTSKNANADVKKVYYETKKALIDVELTKHWRSKSTFNLDEEIKLLTEIGKLLTQRGRYDQQLQALG